MSLLSTPVALLEIESHSVGAGRYLIIFTMWSLSLLAVSTLALVQSFAVGLVLPSDEAQYRQTNRSVNAQTQQELASVLKCNTTIIGPSDPGWADATERYMQNIQPRVQLSVRPSCEQDVARIVSIVLISITDIISTPHRCDTPIATISHFMQSAVAIP